jgi:hypothetical protein
MIRVECSNQITANGSPGKVDANGQPDWLVSDITVMHFLLHIHGLACSDLFIGLGHDSLESGIGTMVLRGLKKLSIQ